MPFSETTEKHHKKYWDYFYKKLCIVINENRETIKKIFNVSGLEIHRASAPQGNIVGSIVRDLKESYIVIAVLTDRNPNVFYELGIRHTQSKRTIMLCEESQKLPFDLYNYGIILYKDNRFRYKRIKKELIERFEQIASNPDKSDNPYFDFIGSQPNSAKSQKPQIKLTIINQIEGEPSPHPPMFYREAERTGGKANYKNRTFFSLMIELINYSTDNISIIDTTLDGDISSQHFSTDKLYHGNSVETAKATFLVKPNYKNKLNLEPRRIYQYRLMFVLEQSIPDGISEVSGKVHIVDMFDNKYSTPEVKFIPYC
jgi:hypothetical protein